MFNGNDQFGMNNIDGSNKMASMQSKGGAPLTHTHRGTSAAYDCRRKTEKFNKSQWKIE